MKKLFGILKYIKGYWSYACLNITSNLLSVFFNLFSLAMIAPFLKLLFTDGTADYSEVLAKGAPGLSLSVNSILGTFNFYLTRIIVSEGKASALVLICVLVVCIMFLKNVFRYLGMYFIAPIRNGVVRDIRNKVFGKIQDLPLSYYTEERKGDIMSRMTTDVYEIEWSVMSSLEMLFRDPIHILISLVFLLVTSPSLTLFVLILLPVTGILVAIIGKSLKRSSAKAKERMGALMSVLEETLSGLRIIKAFNAEKNTAKKFESENQSYNRLMIKIYRKTDLASPMSEFLVTVVMMVILYFGGMLVLGKQSALTGDVFIMYLAVFQQMITPAKSLTSAYYNVQKGLASADRINKILDAESTIREIPGAQPIRSFEKEIEYRDVSFAYRRGDSGHVLKHISLKVPKGKTIALVGQSGSGKSTLADMLPRFYEVDEGELLIDGINIKQLKINDLRSLMGIVTQESILFNETVFNNIAFGMEQAKESDVIAAAKVANAHEFIMQMPQGYQTNIGDRGGKLSGGQRQRLSIARAVLKNPPILILDEATSALDTESERLVQDALNKLMQQRTSLVIAHRLSTIQHADEIVVLQKGAIVERGTHASLLALGGHYKKLYDMQAFV